MTETAEMQEAEPVAWRWRERFPYDLSVDAAVLRGGRWSLTEKLPSWASGNDATSEFEPLYSQSDFDAMRAQRDEALAQVATLQAQITRLREALSRVERWHGEFPVTGRTWPSGDAMSYAALFGSDGERDFMRDIARQALSEPSPSNSGDTP